MKTKLRREYIAQFYRKNQLPFVLAFLVALLTNALNLGITWLMQQIMDTVSQVPGALPLSVLGCLTAGIVVCILFFKAITYCTKPRFMQRAMLQYKDFVFRRLTKKSISAFQQEPVSQYLSFLSNDLNTIETNYLEVQFTIPCTLLMVVGSICMMLMYSPVMTLVALIFCSMPALAAVFAGNRLEQAEKQVSQYNAGFLASLRDCLNGFSVMKSFKAEERMAAVVHESNCRVEDAKCHKQKLNTILYTLGAVAGVSAQFGTFLVGCFLSLKGFDLTPGRLIAYMDLTGLFIQGINQLPALLANRKAALGLIDKLAEKLEENVQEEGTTEKAVLQNGIAVRNLSFAYEQDKPILKNISCNFDAGKSYAIVGASGSGKSTLLHILTSSYHGYSGTIDYDDVELKEIRSDALYGMLSVIQQNVFIFNASIRDNITMFADFPDEEVQRAIRLSGLSKLIAEKGEAYRCGENGVNLSGGEKQRISIARSLLRNAQILLADEVTAALDAETSYQVNDAILNLRSMTRIVVTHALDAAVLCRYDRILAMKSGEIVESGTFEELMNQKGYFYSLYTVSQ